ncbi:MAG: hypothetical protein Q8T04_03425 [Bacteroidota bacterium]|nr:hypothetical protein [Bacteroidota bacterium]
MQENTRDISAIKSRILQYAEKQHISKYELYQKTGISNGVFSQKGGISEDNLLKFLSHYNSVSEKWLLTGRGQMIEETIPTQDNNNTNNCQLDLIVKLSAENALLKKENEELKLKKR